jgi:hypothetical protein
VWGQYLAERTGISYSELYEVTNEVRTHAMGINKGYLDSVKTKFLSTFYLKVGALPIKFNKLPTPSSESQQKD